MIPNVTTGRGLSGALAYVMGPGHLSERRLAALGVEGRATIIGGQNFSFAIDSPEAVEIARRVMEWNATPNYQGGGSDRWVGLDCQHISLSWEKTEKPDAATMEAAARSVLRYLGMERAFAVFVAHRDTAHPHVHIVASRIDPESGRPFDNFKTTLKIQGWAVRYEQEQGLRPAARQHMHDLVNAIDARNIAGVLAYMTRTEATFDKRALDRALTFGITDQEERHKFKLEVLADREVIGLRVAADEAVTHYTTRSILALENTVLDAAAKLAAGRGYGVKEKRLSEIEKAHTLIPEQAAALRHATGGNRLVLVAGEGGTGKSHTMSAVRAAYEATGRRVVAMSWTNKVVLAMEADGFKEARTVQVELGRQKKGIGAWSAKTVVVVDEAAQLSTQATADILACAKATGAKVILVGDPSQLGSIEKGGMFRVLANTHGAATLRQVMRTKDAEYQAAWSEMHDGHYLKALQRFEKKGDIFWSQTQAQSMRALTDKYAADVKDDPAKTRMIFAHTNQDVDELNLFARQVARDQGRLGADVKVQTAAGPLDLATGDRIQFSENGRGKEAKAAGYVNGQTVTITGIEARGGVAQRMTVQLDAKKGEKPKKLTFKIGADRAAGEFDALRLGYASTVYKGQGATLCQSYVYHSQGWKSATSYVALTRARERVSLFASKEVVTGAGGEAWMQQQGGIDALDPRMADSARESFEKWKEEMPVPAARYGLTGYVAFVQEQWASEDRAGTDLEKLARMMSRSEEKKAASSFIASEIVVPEAFVVAAREGSVFQRAAEALHRRFGLEEQKQQGSREKGAKLPPTPAAEAKPSPVDEEGPSFLIDLSTSRCQPPPPKAPVDAWLEEWMRETRAREQRASRPPPLTWQEQKAKDAAELAERNRRNAELRAGMAEIGRLRRAAQEAERQKPRHSQSSGPRMEP